MNLQFNNPLWFVLFLALFLISAAHVPWLASGRFGFGAALMTAGFVTDAALRVAGKRGLFV